MIQILYNIAVVSILLLIGVFISIRLLTFFKDLFTRKGLSCHNGGAEAPCPDCHPFNEDEF